MKTLSFTAKCSDLFGGNIYTDDDDTSIELEGYVPYNIGIGGGDYIEMKIDIETGKIIGWESRTS